MRHRPHKRRRLLERRLLVLCIGRQRGDDLVTPFTAQGETPGRQMAFQAVRKPGETVQRPTHSLRHRRARRRGRGQPEHLLAHIPGLPFEEPEEPVQFPGGLLQHGQHQGEPIAAERRRPALAEPEPAFQDAVAHGVRHGHPIRDDARGQPQARHLQVQRVLPVEGEQPVDQRLDLLVRVFDHRQPRGRELEHEGAQLVSRHLVEDAQPRAVDPLGERERRQELPIAGVGEGDELPFDLANEPVFEPAFQDDVGRHVGRSFENPKAARPLEAVPLLLTHAPVGERRPRRQKRLGRRSVSGVSRR